MDLLLERLMVEWKVELFLLELDKMTTKQDRLLVEELDLHLESLMVWLLVLMLLLQLVTMMVLLLEISLDLLLAKLLVELD